MGFSFAFRFLLDDGLLNTFIGLRILCGLSCIRVRINFFLNQVILRCSLSDCRGAVLIKLLNYVLIVKQEISKVQTHSILLSKATVGLIDRTCLSIVRIHVIVSPTSLTFSVTGDLADI